MAAAGDSGQPPVLAMLASNARCYGHVPAFSIPVVVATPVSRANRLFASARALDANPPAQQRAADDEEGLPDYLRGRRIPRRTFHNHAIVHATLPFFLVEIVPLIQQGIWKQCRAVKAVTFGVTYSITVLRGVPPSYGQAFIEWVQVRFPRDEMGTRVTAPKVVLKSNRVLHIAVILRPGQIKDFCSFADSIKGSYGQGHVRILSNAGDA
eukprot:5603670-Pleurochrysis_carterae.AAC.1